MVKIENIVEENNTLTFTLKEVSTPVANGIRRVILSEIETIVLDTDNSLFSENTTRFHNELIKQRLSCIPIHLDAENDEYLNYSFAIKEQNNTSHSVDITTENFKIIYATTEKEGYEMIPAETLCPPYISPKGDRYFIPLLTLRNKISEEILGEKISFIVKLKKGKASEDSCFNVVSTCSYKFTPEDENVLINILNELKQKWKQEGLNEEEIYQEEKNWLLLDKFRHYKENSFDFIIETIGVYSNIEIVKRACNVLIKKLNYLKENITIKPANSTMNECFDIILKNEDYTLGYILQHYYLMLFYETKISYCGFKKEHPHDNFSILRVSYKKNPNEEINNDFIFVIDNIINTFEEIIKELK